MFLCQVIFCFRLRFHVELLKMATSAVLHLNITCQMINTVPGTQTVLRTARKSCGEFSPEVPGVPWQANSAYLYTVYSVSCEIYRINKK